MKKRIIGRMKIMLLVVCMCVNGLYIPASAAEYKTEYRYHRYIDDNGNVSVCPYYGNWKYNTNTMKIQYSDWMETPLQIDNGKYSCYSHVNQGKSCSNAGCIDVTVDMNRHVDKHGTYWFYQETRMVEVKPVPTAKPTAAPTAKPTAAPTAKPTAAPTAKPTAAPTAKPTAAPTAKPTAAPTAKPTVAPTAKPTAAPTAKPTVVPTTKPTAVLVDMTKPVSSIVESMRESGKNIILFKENPEEDNSIWDEIGVGLLEYAIDVFDSIVDSLNPTEELELVKALLSHKELIKSLLNAEFLGMIEDEAVLNQLLEIMENKGMSNDTLSEAATLLYYVAEKQPELKSHIIFTLIKHSPQTVIKIATKIAGVKVPLFNIVFGVFEVSAERYWVLGEAFAEYANAYGELEETLEARYNDFLAKDAQFTYEVAMLILEDRSSGEAAHQNEVMLMENTMRGIRDDICGRLDTTLTFWFRILHPQITGHLEDLKDELESMEFDYLKYYIEGIKN